MRGEGSKDRLVAAVMAVAQSDGVMHVPVLSITQVPNDPAHAIESLLATKRRLVQDEDRSSAVLTK